VEEPSISYRAVGPDVTCLAVGDDSSLVSR
jgi:hypothetical protein